MSEWRILVLARWGLAAGVFVAGMAAPAAQEGFPGPGVRAWTNSLPRVFLKVRRLRIYSGADERK